MFKKLLVSGGAVALIVLTVACKPGGDTQVPAESVAAVESSVTADQTSPFAPSAPDGQAIFRMCAACHSLTSGKNQVGPSLAGILGRSVASHADYIYSDALQNFGGSWTVERLDAFIADPHAAVPGTKMTFPGVKDPARRAALIAYLGEQH